MGGKCAYRGRLGNDRSPRHSHHCIASAKQVHRPDWTFGLLDCRLLPSACRSRRTAPTVGGLTVCLTNAQLIRRQGVPDRQSR
jgi:hypothetical protein